tara:strand:- start:2728 stop:4125 length:1398 start_codon:yes stop_codon:yes gene_type:complete
MDATQSLTNPFEYSIEKQVPFHGVQYIRHDPVNAASFGASSSIDFDLTKLGFLRSCIFTWNTTPPTGAQDCPPSGTLNAIDRIELLSASRRLAVMDRHALKAAFSDMPADVRSNYLKGLHSVSSGKQLPDGETYTSHLFVPMAFFCNIKNSLALSFVEPVKLRIVMSNNQYTVIKSGTHGSGDGEKSTRGTMALSAPELYCEYRVLDPESEDATIEANYDNVLTQLSYDYHTEVEATGTLAADGELDLSVELKDPGVVSAAYVIVSCDYDDIHSAAELTNGAAGSSSAGNTQAKAQQMQKNMVAAEQPLICTSIGFKASGQDIIPTMPARIVELFGRRDLSTHHHSTGFGNTYMSRDDPTNLHNVYKLNFGLDENNKYNSGGISLRELNAPTISVQVRRASGGATTDEDGGADEGQRPETTGKLGSNQNPGVVAGKKVKMRVILKKHTLISTDPASGRLVQSISN